MRPDQRWFPTNRVERATWFNSFAINFEKVALDLGFTQAEIDSVHADNAVVQYLSRSIASLEAQVAAFRSYHRTITGGRSNGQMHTTPEIGLPTPPDAVPQGIFERLENRVRRIRVAYAYTPSIGALLQIIPKAEAEFDLNDFVPKIKVKSETEPYTFTVRCARLNFSGFEVSFSRTGTGNWENAGRFHSAPAVISFAPSEPGKPEKIYVRVRMLKGNDAVGLYSEVTEIVV